FFLMIPPPPRPTLFPYTTLFRSHPRRLEDRVREHPEQTPKRGGEPLPLLDLSERRPLPDLPRMIHEHRVPARPEDAIRLAEERRSEEHTSELQSRGHLVCRLLLE